MSKLSFSRGPSRPVPPGLTIPFKDHRTQAQVRAADAKAELMRFQAWRDGEVSHSFGGLRFDDDGPGAA